MGNPASDMLEVNNLLKNKSLWRQPRGFTMLYMLMSFTTGSQGNFS